jgi:hypothetical protein
MPTPNDSLYSPINNENNPPTKTSPNQNPALLRKTSSPYFASPQVRSSVEGSKVSSKAQSPMSAPPPALPRSQSSLARKSANSVPKPPEPVPDEEPDPEDKIFWYNLYMETIDNHDRERSSMGKAIRQLKKEVETLKNELHDTRSRIVRAGNGYMDRTIEEDSDDKTFTTQAIINNANAKLREFSVVSPERERGNPFDKPSPTQLDGVKIRNKSVGMSSRDKSSSRGPSLSRRVTIADETAVTIDEPDNDKRMLSLDLYTPLKKLIISAVDQVIPPEDPASPPPTAFYGQSPPPQNFIMHAGSTPRSVRGLIARDAKYRAQTGNHNHSQSIASAMANHDSEFSVTLKPQAPMPAPTNPSRIALPDVTDADDGDRQLKSPQMLPTNPPTPNSQKNDPFSVLTSKLERIASDPEQQIPVVLKSHKSLAHEDEMGVSMKKMEGNGFGKAKELTNCGSGNKGYDSEKDKENAKVDSVIGEGDGNDDGEAEEVGEIVFRKTKFTNFGAPLGQLK